jgi:tRNA pseudouridine13 synthase
MKMKLKQTPEDFQVEELTNVIQGEQGEFALYRLEKKGWTTVDAVQAIRRRWHLNRNQVSYGGLKDRHAKTVQYLTIFKGPRRDLQHDTVSIKYLGQVAQSYSSQFLRANRFSIVLRNINPGQMVDLKRTLGEVIAGGVPNYFDDQRFGSVGEAREFVAKYMVLGQYEKALKLALLAPYAFDRGGQKNEKAILRKHWGDWRKCKAFLARGQAAKPIDYLISRPTDFRGALIRLPGELGTLFLSAYQSHLWNQILARSIRRVCRPEQMVTVRTRLGELPMHRDLDELQTKTLADLLVPLPSARIKIDPSDPLATAINEVLADEGFKLGDMKLKGIREPFFSKANRAALLMPADLRFEFQDDENHAGQKKLMLAFDLPRGCYATMIVKRIQAG